MKKIYSKNSRQGLPGGPNEMFEKVKGIIVSQRGQWDFPGMNTMVPTDDGRITMRGVPYPVYGQDETGYGQMMYPNQEYQFPGKNVLELPMAQVGLQVPIQQPDALRVHMNINPNAEYMEKKKSDVLDLDNTLDYLVETRGGTRDLWGHMADTIGYHESGHTMDPLQMQNSGGPGRGIFQFEAPSLITAQNRYQRISDRLKLKPDPKILSAKSALELSPEQQYSLFLINLAESSAKLKDYADNKLPLVDLWLQGHKKIEKGENRGSFRTSVQKAKDESIQKGYDSFKKLGGSLPRAQNGLTVSDIWEQQTGTPWSEAKNKGYTSGSFQDNVKLRQQLLSGTFNNNVTQSTTNTLQSQPLTNDTGVIDIKANDFNEAFKQARNTLGANKIFVWNGRKYGTNLKGEDFKPDEKTLSDAGLNDKQTKFRLEKENNALQDPYIGKSTVKLEGDWKDLEEVKTDKKEYEKSSQAERIVRYKNEIKDNKSYVIVDKEKGLLHIYKPGESKPIFTSGIDLGKNIGDDQTVTKALDTNKDGITTETDKVKNRWVVDWEKGSGTTGAGRYYVSNITKNSIEPGYEGYPSINMMNERQYDEFKKSGKIENISTSFHKGYVVDDNNRVSNGCIRCNKTTLNNLVQQLSNSSEVYILPEDIDEQGNLINEFVYENGKLNFRTKDYNKYLTYKDSKGQIQKGQGLNKTEQTLNYKPITLGYDPVRLSVLSKGTHDEGVVESFSDALSDNKQKIMKVAQINGDIYNEIAKMTFGILGAETNWGETFNIGENVVKGIGRMITSKVGGPDYSFKADVGRTNPDDSVGLTQLKWKWVSEGERKKLKELGITSSEDFLDPQKAAIGTAVILGIRYNEQLKTDQKANIWENLPPKWNNRSNYARRIKFNSAPVFVSEYTGDPKKGDVIKQNYKKETTKKLIENTIKQDSLKPFISESTGLNPLTRNINYQQINFPKQQLGGALPQFQYTGQFNPQLARPNPLTGKYAWEQSIPKKAAVNVAPKMQPAARATTNVQKQNLNLDRDNRLLDANLIYSDASSNPLSNAVHTGLDAVGMVPLIGEPADLANALLYNYEGDLENAALSTAGMIPFLGMLGTGKRLLGKAKKAFSQSRYDPDFWGPVGPIPQWGDRANPKLLVQSPPEIKPVFKGVTHYGKDPALEAAKGALDVVKEQGRYLDNISFDASKLSPEQVKFHGIKHGRAVVEVALPNGNTQLFYKSSGLAGKSGAGVGNTTQGLWQPYGGHASNYTSSNWFIKDEGYKDWYGSKSFRDISGNLDRIAAEGNYDLSGQLKAFKKLGGSLPKAQVGDEIFPGEGQYYNIPEYTYNYKRGFDDLPDPVYSGPLMNQRLIDEATQREYEQRRRAIEESVAAAREPLSTQRLARESAATGDKFSLQMNLGDPYNNPRLYETLGALDFINPGVMLGDMVTGLGSVPYNVQEGNYGAAAVGLGLPLATGALAAIGVKTPRQFVNNLVNPVAGIGDTPKQLPGSSNVAPVINAARNLEDLKAAQQFAQKYGYELPANLERVAQSNEFTDRVIRGMMNRHNTFVRGVSTNWEVLGQKNPEIIKHLEGKGFNLGTEEGSKAAAEYMSTHIPMNTGYGRFGLKEGEHALYLSNSVPAGEGYTYGSGYVVTAKRPTDFSSANRQNWLTANNFDAHRGFKGSPFGQGIVKNDYIKRFPTNFRETLAITGDPTKMTELQNAVSKKEILYNDLAHASWKKHNNLISDLKYRTDANYRNNIIRRDDSFVRDVPNVFDQMHLNLLESKRDFMQNYYNLLPLKDIVKGVYGDADVWKAFGKNLFRELDPFSHYAIKGQEGEKVLEALRSTKVTPDIWQNTSRAHINKYTNKLSRRQEGGAYGIIGGSLPTAGDPVLNFIQRQSPRFSKSKK